jgi:hypothetical protein
MPATATGRGAQVILDGDAQRAARGAYANSYVANAMYLDSLARSGAVADGMTTPDGTTRTGTAASDYIVAVTSARLDASLAAMSRAAAGARYNNPRVNAIMATPPTISVSTTHNAALTKSYGWNGGPGGADIYAAATGNGPFNYSGGLPTSLGYGVVDFPSVHYQTTNYQPLVKRMETVADSIKVELGVWPTSTTAASSAFRIIVDRQYVSLTQTLFTTPGIANFITLDFTAAGGRKARNIILEGLTDVKFGSITSVGPTETLLKPGGAVKTMYVVADSWGVGNTTTMLNAFPGYLGDLLGIRNTWNGGVPGTGWLADAGGTSPTCRGRIGDLVDCAPDLLVITMGYNDVSASLTALQNEVTLTLRTIRAQPVRR